MPRRIEVLVFDGCPSAEAAIARVHEAVHLARVAATVEVVRVDSEADAARLRFLGSPSVRVDGVDVDSGACERTDFGMQCRVYSSDGHFTATPPAAWIAAALLRPVES